MNKRGQFFSPDMIIAILLFLVIISFFSFSSDYLKNRVSFFDNRRLVDDSLHATMNSLVYSSGNPAFWQEATSVSDINNFGLALTPSFLSEKKVERFFYFVENEYSSAKNLLSTGRNDFFVELIDANGVVINSAGVIASEYTVKSTYSKIVYYGGRQCILRGYFSYEE